MDNEINWDLIARFLNDEVSEQERKEIEENIKTNSEYREILEYAPDGMVTLRLVSRKLIVFDHLDPIIMGHENDPEYYGAAGLSFDGYKLKKGLWRFVSDIDIRKLKQLL